MIEKKGLRFFYGYIIVATAFYLQMVIFGRYNTFVVYFVSLQTQFD